MFNIRCTCSDAELVADRVIGRRPAVITVQDDGSVDVERLRAQVSEHAEMWSKTQNSDFAFILSFATQPFRVFLLAVFAAQMKIRSDQIRQMRPVVWVFRQIMWRIVFIIEKRLIGRVVLPPYNVVIYADPCWSISVGQLC